MRRPLPEHLDHEVALRRLELHAELRGRLLARERRVAQSGVHLLLLRNGDEFQRFARGRLEPRRTVGLQGLQVGDRALRGRPDPAEDLRGEPARLLVLREAELVDDLGHVLAGPRPGAAERLPGELHVRRVAVRREVEQDRHGRRGRRPHVPEDSQRDRPGGAFLEVVHGILAERGHRLGEHIGGLRVGLPENLQDALDVVLARADPDERAGRLETDEELRVLHRRENRRSRGAGLRTEASSPARAGTASRRSNPSSRRGMTAASLPATARRCASRRRSPRGRSRSR